jgi:CDP-diacylglycerol---glycerol-3-phosphate 3-phosphatidyltransferase
MFRHIPNALTAGRLVLAAVFFGLLGFYQHEGKFFQYETHGSPGLLNIAFGIYVIALVTDFLDGYLARKWKVEGAFGRVVDPFVDKVLVIGTFIFFAGMNFIAIVPAGPANTYVITTTTGVAPWMVVVILARELLVTSLRGLSESSGQNFGAALSGKLKMGFQSGTILAILVYVNYLSYFQYHHWEDYALGVRDFGIWGTIVITVTSGLMYVRRAMTLYRQSLLAQSSI